ncbi:hypothetical protein [uncultured Methanobrevibacter sp.]|uniref:hypothetical protein n=1 Tax=uncultured Methanobrevibacter sp. TaxID=253161 RepID=UPI0025CC1FC1|nr:hypothetical protein [uncultured Methanobrevibacter sp.]
MNELHIYINQTIKEPSWIPLIIVCLDSFIITLDTTFMNVSIPSFVKTNVI